MSRGGAIFVACLLAAAFLWAALELMGVRFAAGDIYPEYSSLRADAMGSKLLFDSLARLPGLNVSRTYTPLDLLEGSSQTVMVLGAPPSSMDAMFLEQLRRLAARGNRVVVGLTLPRSADAPMGDLEGKWGVKPELDKNEAHARRLYFTAAKDWKVIERAGNKLLEVERTFDKGSVLLFADSDTFANESLVMGERLGVITATIGADTRVVFDESHLGITASGSVMGLARRYRLMGFALGLAICAALALWKNASPFPAPGDEPVVERMLARTSSSGLATLLGRYIPQRELAAASWQEWLKSNRRSVAAERVEKAAAIVAANQPPLDAMREIQTVLRTKGAI